jgi:integrase
MQSKRTKYPGVQRMNERTYRVRFKIVDQRTGKPREVDRLVEATSTREASEKRADLMKDEREKRVATSNRVRVGAFAKSWIDSKLALVDRDSAKGYIDDLEKHILPAFGDFYYDALRASDVQAWVNECLRKKAIKRNRYAVRTVHKWYRTLRAMTRDAVVQLDLPRDPMRRIAFPQPPERTMSNALTPEELQQFLAAMREHYPRNYALTMLLAFTGLRFCHASALRWEDIDEEKSVIHIVRKNARGRAGEISQKKRAPREIPLLPELRDVLREHRKRMVEKQEKGLAKGWVFPSESGELRKGGCLRKSWGGALKAANIGQHFTVHGLRRTFNDLARRAGIDAVVIRSMTGHVTESMREHYSTVGLDEKQSAVANVLRLVKP